MKRSFFAPRGRSGLERLARLLLLGGVFALVIVAFQKHFDRVVDQAAARGTVYDPGGILSTADRGWILEQAGELRRRYGLELRLRLGGPPRPPEPDDPRTLYVFFDPGCWESRVIAPALAASALPGGLLDDLGREHLDAACREGRPREAVPAALGLLIDALADAAGRAKGEGS